MRYAIIIEKGKRNYAAYAPDVSGCVATGDTLAEVKRMMKDALEFHFTGMMEAAIQYPNRLHAVATSMHEPALCSDVNQCPSQRRRIFLRFVR
jgi:predicted RNase H-like HicB family nuclease